MLTRESPKLQGAALGEMLASSGVRSFGAAPSSGAPVGAAAPRAPHSTGAFSGAGFLRQNVLAASALRPMAGGPASVPSRQTPRAAAPPPCQPQPRQAPRAAAAAAPWCLPPRRSGRANLAGNSASTPLVLDDDDDDDEAPVAPLLSLPARLPSPPPPLGEDDSVVVESKRAWIGAPRDS
jgi:hypothetical protein